MNKIPQASVWKYHGRGIGRGLLHIVTGMVDDEVCTISQGLAKDSFVGQIPAAGLMWCGSVPDFLRDFDPVPMVPTAS